MIVGWANSGTFWGRSPHPRGRSRCPRGVRLLLSLLLPLCGIVGGAPIAPAATAAESAPSVLRVGTSGDYAPFSVRSSSAPDGVDGFDLAVARAYAADRGLAVEPVRFRWPSLVAGLETDRFDVAMSGITVRPERSLAGRFTVPVAESGAVVLVNDLSRWRDLDALDANGVRIAVNFGGHLERVARQRFPHATLLALRSNPQVLEVLLTRHADAAVTDTLEAPVWRRRQPDLGQLGPFTRDEKAYLVRADRGDLARDLDRWLLEREADGTLARLRTQHFGEGEWRATAAPLPALCAAVKERLELMPLVARAKAREGVPLEVPAQEERVLAGAVAAAQRAAEALALAPPAAARVRALVRAQIEAAKAVQTRELDRGGFEQAAPPSLDGALRPALLRIGDRMGDLAARLAAAPAPRRSEVEDAVDDALADLDLDARHERALVAAVLALAGSTRSAAHEGAGRETGDDGQEQ